MCNVSEKEYLPFVWRRQNIKSVLPTECVMTMTVVISQTEGGENLTIKYFWFPNIV